jgi:hypothetical protein
VFIQCFVYLPCSSVNVLDRHIHITRKETTTNGKRNGKEDRKEDEEEKEKEN